MQKVVSGTLTSVSSEVVVSMADFETFIVQFTGTWSGVLEIQGTLDGTNYRQLNVVDITDNGGYGVLQIPNSSAGIWKPFTYATLPGLQKLRVKFLSLSSGSANVTVVATGSAK